MYLYMCRMPCTYMALLDGWFEPVPVSGGELPQPKLLAGGLAR